MRLIDGDYLVDKMITIEDPCKAQKYCYPCAEVLKAIREAPTYKEACRIVECKDCKHYMLEKLVSTDEEIEYCTLTNSTVFANDFCSRGQLREEQEAE